MSDPVMDAGDTNMGNSISVLRNIQQVTYGLSDRRLWGTKECYLIWEMLRSGVHIVKQLILFRLLFTSKKWSEREGMLITWHVEA